MSQVKYQEKRGNDWERGNRIDFKNICLSILLSGGGSIKSRKERINIGIQMSLLRTSIFIRIAISNEGYEKGDDSWQQKTRQTNF